MFIELERSSTSIKFRSRLDDAAVAVIVAFCCPIIRMKYKGTVTVAVTVTRRVPNAGESTGAVGADGKEVPSHPEGKFACTYCWAIVVGFAVGLRPAARAAASTAADSLAFDQNKIPPSIASPVKGSKTSADTIVKRRSAAPRSLFLPCANFLWVFIGLIGNSVAPSMKIEKTELHNREPGLVR